MSSKTVCIIGAGYGGICAGVQLQRLLNWNTFTIYELNEDVGGVWFTNRYPNCGNDTPSIGFTYSFEPKADFSHSYCSSEENCNYVRDVAMKHNLYPKIKFNTQIKSVVWNERLKKWNITSVNTRDQRQTEKSVLFDFVICATGHFRNPVYPEKFLRFKGPIIHTAEWKSDVELEDKIVAVIGGGASAVQLIPAIVDKVKTLHSYQRQPVWGIPLRPVFKIPKLVQWIFANVPFVLYFLQILMFFMYECMWFFQRTDLNFGSKMERFILYCMRKHFPDGKEKIEVMTPKYKFGCKRAGFSHTYYPSLARPNVKLHSENVTRVTDDALITKDGNEEKIDVLILGTGFDTQMFFGPMQIIGKNGENILSTWQNFSPSLFYGVTSNSMPNLFFINGPFSDSGNNSTVILIEMQTRLIMRILKELRRRRAQSVAVKASPEKDYMKYLQSWNHIMVQGKENCNAYYKNSRNEPTQLLPYPFTLYWLRTRFPDFSKFEFS